MSSMNQSQLTIACNPSYQAQSRWLSALSTLRYRAGHIDAYLEELVSGLRHGIGACWVMIGQCQNAQTKDYCFTISPEPQLDVSQNLAEWTQLSHSIIEQVSPNIGIHSMQADFSMAYCGVPLQASQDKCCGILLALRPTIEPFQTKDQQVLALMANQAAMAIELDRWCHGPDQQSVSPIVSVYPSHEMQDKLFSINQQLSQKLDHYRTELQRVSAQLQIESIAHSALEQRFRRIFEESNDAIFVIDPEQDKILEANPRAAQMLNYSRQELLTTVKVSQVHPKEMPRLMAFTRSVFRNGRGWTDEFTCLTKSNTQLSAEISAAPIDFEGRQCMLAMVRDISDRKRARLEAQKALSHLAEVGELASMIVHEIRNPLTTVLMGLTSFQKLELDSRFQSRLDIALAEAERLKRLLNEILLFSKPQILDCNPLELNKWSADLLVSLQSHPLVSDRTITFNANPIPTIVSADSDRLKQVFINLITNACEAIAPGEQVTWEIAHPSKADWLTVRINNGGQPIPPVILEKITAPFFTTKSNGNGLGLAIVKRIVTAHRGQLDITSDATTGTTVTIRLPLLRRGK